jgi:hypothetical protein
MPAGDTVSNPAPGTALQKGDNIHRNPEEHNPPRNIIGEGTPNDLPDRNNVRTPNPQPILEGSNPAGYGPPRDGAAAEKPVITKELRKNYRRMAEDRSFHKFLKWMTLN